jgi:hypothetical protein
VLTGGGATRGGGGRGTRQRGRCGMEDAVAQGRAGGGGLGGRHGVDRWGWRRRGVRAGGAGLNGWAGGQWGVRWAGGTRSVGRAVWGPSSGRGTWGWGRVGAHLARLVGWTVGSRRWASDSSP